jgi:tetratricopeptide (TPR) repeat protein
MIKSWWKNITTWVRPSWYPYLLILVAGWLVYARSLWFDFTYLDDSTLLLDNFPVLRQLRNIPYLFSTDVFISNVRYYYRPLLNLSFALDAQISGQLPGFYHFSSILIHCLVAALVFYLLSYFSRSRTWPLILALVFLLHPVNVPAVVWIPGRNDSLLAIFVLAGFIAFLHFIRQPRLSYYVACLGFLLAALLTKESAIALPLLMLIYVWWIDSGNLLPSDRYLLLSGSGMIVFIWWLLRVLALGSGGGSYGAAVMSSLASWPALFLDLGKVLLPFNLSVFPVLADANLYYGGAAVIIWLAIIYWLPVNNKKLALFGWLWFFLFLGPSFLRFNGQPDFLEHRLYLPLVGLVIFISQITSLTNLVWSRRSVRVVTVIILLGLAGLSYQQSRYYSDRLTFWQRAVHDSPHSALAEKNLGLMYYFDGNLSAAIQHDTQALRLNPTENIVHNNLGVIYLNEHKYQQAEQEFQQELLVNPNYDKALFNLGDLAYQQGSWVAAQQYFNAVLRVNPNYEEAVDRLLILQNRLR